MARDHVALALPKGSDLAATLSDRERHEIQQYSRIVRFHDDVFAGKHPTIKPLPTVPTAAPSPPVPNALPIPVASAESSVQISAPTRKSANAHVGAEPQAKLFATKRPEINPIFLEKSDDLKRAELQLKRKRIEGALKDEFEQRRGTRSEKAEPLAEFDLSNVLNRALKLVEATPTALAAEDGSATNNDASSDSFDDNTFYSSQHETPESHLTSRVRNESDEVEARANDDYESRPVFTPRESQHNSTVTGLASRAASEAQRAPLPKPAESYPEPTPSQVPNPAPIQVPGLNNYSNDATTAYGGFNGTGRQQSRLGGSGRVEAVTHHQQAATNTGHRLDDSYVDAHPPSPLVRAHDLLPVAPQPSQVSSLAVERNLARTGDPNLTNFAQAAPAQVTALRSEPVAVTSPESSPRAGHASEKKNKKKKRKADRQAPEDVVPYIKPEPRSPSPTSAPIFTRPNKRQKQSERQPIDADADELMILSGQPQRFEAPSYRRDAAPVSYDRVNNPQQRPASTALVGEYRPREYVDDRRVPQEVYVRQQTSPHLQPLQRPPSAAYRGGPVSQVIVDDGYREPPRYYREPFEPARASVRPEADAYMTQPTAPRRIVVDAYGREYIEPPRHTVRQSVAPASTYGEPEIVYESQPARAVSRHQGPAAYDDGGMVYARPVSTYSAPRRVMTQPEYAPREYQEEPRREYSTRPAPMQTEYVQIMPPPERQLAAEPPREYISRGASVRPAETVRYEMPREYERVQSVRPEGQLRQYTRSVHPEAHPETLPPAGRDYGPPVVRQGYSVRPVERYYEPGQARGTEEIAYIERPRGATQEIVYTDNVRRDVYR